jgi:membrane-associated phospholipid phosphatase
MAFSAPAGPPPPSPHTIAAREPAVATRALRGRRYLWGAGASALFLALISAGVARGGLFRQLDAGTLSLVQRSRTPDSYWFENQVTHLADQRYFALLAAAVLLFGLLTGRRRAAIAGVVAIGGTLLTTRALQHLGLDAGARAGPDVGPFPSAHVAAAAALGAAATLQAGQTARALVVAISAAYVATVAFSVVYVGTHLATHVAGGLACAGVWSCVAAAWLTRSAPPRTATRSAARVVLLVLAAGVLAAMLAPRARELVTHVVDTPVTPLLHLTGALAIACAAAAAARLEARRLSAA